MRLVFPSHSRTALMDELATDVGSLVESFFGPSDSKSESRGPGQAIVPMDVQENDQQYRVILDVPGVSLEAIEITVHEDTVTIAGNRGGEAADAAAESPDDSSTAEDNSPDSEKKEANFRFLRRERRGGSFQRSLQLPKAIEADEVAAELADGVLVLTLPKADPNKGRRRIAISRG